MSNPLDARLIKIERAIGAIIIYAERQERRQDSENLHVLRRYLMDMDVLSYPELARIRDYFAERVPRG